jgi:hypothetical protein
MQSEISSSLLKKIQKSKILFACNNFIAYIPHALRLRQAFFCACKSFDEDRHRNVHARRRESGQVFEGGSLAPVWDGTVVGRAPLHPTTRILR